MTAGKLHEVRAQPVAGDSPRPLAANDPIFVADDVSASHRGEFNQRKRQGEAAGRLGSKTNADGPSWKCSTGAIFRGRDRTQCSASG